MRLGLATAFSGLLALISLGVSFQSLKAANAAHYRTAVIPLCVDFIEQTFSVEYSLKGSLPTGSYQSRGTTYPIAVTLPDIRNIAADLSEIEASAFLLMSSDTFADFQKIVRKVNQPTFADTDEYAELGRLFEKQKQNCRAIVQEEVESIL